MEEAKNSAEPSLSELWTDIYVEGSGPVTLRGVDPTELHQQS